MYSMFSINFQSLAFDGVLVEYITSTHSNLFHFNLALNESLTNTNEKMIRVDGTLSFQDLRWKQGARWILDTKNELY